LDSTTPTDSAPAARGRGRPVTISRELRREQILKMAESLFKQTGYSSTSMADIARLCETSKRTIYELFPTKEDLFRALVADVESFPDTAHEFDEAASAQEVLEATLSAIAHYVLSERHVTVSRLVIAESNLFPEIRQHYYEQGINRSKQWLESRIATLVKRKRIAPVNVDRTADMLFGAVIGTHLIAAISYRQAPDMAEVAEKSREAVARLVETIK
jgi:AcrR family transcriptional regulator